LNPTVFTLNPTIKHLYNTFPLHNNTLSTRRETKMMAWQNPLRNLPLIPPHPASVTSGLSSAVSDVNLLHESSLEVNNLLDRFGSRNARCNRAASVLGAFVERLPKAGKATLIMEIRSFAEDDEKLLELAQHLVDAILKPCTYIAIQPS
jgi:hypothetical protein